MTHMDRHQWDHELSSASGPSIQLSIIGFDSHCPWCAKVADTIRILLDESRVCPLEDKWVRLSEIIPISPIDFNAPSEVIGKMIAKASTVETWNALESYGSPKRSMRADGQGLLQSYLILPARYLFDEDQRSRFLNDLSQWRDQIASFTILFMDDSDGRSGHDLDHDMAHRYLSDFQCMAPCRVACYLVGMQLDSGRPIPQHEIAVALAVTLANDLLCLPHATERPLTYQAHDDLRTLGAMGGRAVRFSPLELAGVLKNPTTSDLLKLTVFDDDQQLQSIIPQVLLTAGTVMDQIINTAASEHMELKHLVQTSNGDVDDQPRIVGLNHQTHSVFAAGIDFRTSGFKIRMDQLPRTQWIEALSEWDFIHHHEVVDDWLAGVSEAYAARTLQTCDDLQHSILDHIHQYPRLDHAAESVRQLAQTARQAYRTEVKRGQTPDLDASLANLRQTLAGIPHLPSLMARGTVILILQLFLTWTFWSRSLPMAHIVVSSLLVLALVTIGASAWSYLRSVQRAWDARNQAADDIELRCELVAVEHIATGMEAFRETIGKHLEGIADLLDEMDQALRSEESLSGDANEQLNDDIVIHVLPGRKDVDALYAAFSETALACQPDGVVVDPARQMIQQQVAQVLQSKSTAVLCLISKLQQMACEHLERFLLQHSLVEFLQLPDMQSSRMMDEHLDWLTQRTMQGRFFLDSRYTSQCAAGTQECLERLIVPLAMSQMATDNQSLPVFPGVLRNVAARIARVELARLTGGIEG